MQSNELEIMKTLIDVLTELERAKGELICSAGGQIRTEILPSRWG